MKKTINRPIGVSVRKDLTGKRFGRLIAMERIYTGLRKGVKWRCVCDCGNTCNVLGGDLSNGHTTSCGCYRKERNTERFTKHGQTHKTPEYLAWLNMKHRCYNGKNICYHNYGGRGIVVCERWKFSFKNFFSDMGNRPTPEHSLDRFPDTNGNYEPTNCRWATDEQQFRNRTDNVWYEHEGIRLIQSDWAKRWGISRSPIYLRLKNGCSFEDIFNEFEKS